MSNASNENSQELVLSSRALLQRNRSPSPSPSGRTSNTTEEEEAAAAAFAEAQERRANETRRIIRRALRESEDVVSRYLSNDTTRERIGIFQELFENADGVVAKFSLNTLVVNASREGFYVRRNVHRAIARAVQDGFGTNVAESIADAFTILQTQDDHLNLLNAIDERRVILDQQEEDSGCDFVNMLFTDADNVASDRGESIQFIQALEDDEYLPMVECFLQECSGRAASCCTNTRALRRGLCGCPNRRSTRCDFNLFVNLPRTVWICSSSSCEPNEKCLCAAA
eukprot:g4287.t1